MSRGEILLLRHGHLAGDASRLFVGQLDIPLDDLGRSQAEAVGRRLRGVSIDRVKASDLSRCQETARLVLQAAGLGHLPIEPEPALREIHLGHWEGLSREEVRERFAEEYARRGQDMAGTRPSGGESFEDLARRVWPAFERLVAEVGQGRILVVAHSGVNRVILCRVLGLGVEHLFRLDQDYGCLNVIHVDKAAGMAGTAGTTETAGLVLARMNVPPFEAVG